MVALPAHALVFRLLQQLVLKQFKDNVYRKVNKTKLVTMITIMLMMMIAVTLMIVSMLILML